MAAVLCSGSALTGGAVRGLRLCGEVVIPALLPSMMLCAWLSRSGGAALLARVFGGDRTALLLGMIGGYPAGTLCARSLYEHAQLPRERATAAAAVSVGAGPSFLLLGVGGGMLHSSAAGALLLCSNIFATLAVRWAYGIKTKNRTAMRSASVNFNIKKSSEARISLIDAAVLAVADSSAAVLSICAYTLIFSAAGGLLADTPLSVLLPLLEVTSGCAQLCEAGAPLPVIAAAVGFGGCSVIAQLLMLGGDIRPRVSVTLRLRAAHAAASYLICRTLMALLMVLQPAALPAVAVQRTQELTAAVGYAGMPAAVALILCCAVFLCAIAQHTHRPLRELFIC